jgi:hypothetical protein
VLDDLSTKAAVLALGFVARFAEGLNGFAVLVGRESVDIASDQQARRLTASRSIGARTVTRNPLEIHFWPALASR